MQEICFSEIKYKDRCIIWEYDEQNNKATCTYQLDGSKETVYKKGLNWTLDKIEGIKITDGIATIDDVNLFFSKGQQYYLPKKEAFPLVSFTENRESISCFSDSEQSSKNLRIKAGLIPPLRANEIEYPINFESVLREKKYPDIYRKTLVYNKKFSELQQNSVRKNTVFATEQTIMIHEFQLEANQSLYPTKINQLNLLKQLVNEILVPSFYTQPKQSVDYKLFVAYLQRAICEVMENTENSLATKYEKLSLEKRKLKFKSDEAYLNAIYETRLANARIMLRPFLYLVEDYITCASLATEFNDAQLAIQDPDLEIEFPKNKPSLEIKEQISIIETNQKDERARLAEILHDLKEDLAGKKQTIRTIIDKLAKETVQAGSIGYKYNLIKEKTQQELHEKNLGNFETIWSFYSCYFLIKKAIMSNNNVIQKYSPEITKNALEHLILSIIKLDEKEKTNFPRYSAHFNEKCKDLFFTKEHAEQLSTILPTMLAGIKEKDLKNKKYLLSKLPEQLSALILDSIKEQAVNPARKRSRSLTSRSISAVNEGLTATLTLSPRSMKSPPPDEIVVNRNTIFALKSPRKRISQPDSKRENDNNPPVFQ